MTGRTRRLQVGRGDWVWWEPPSPEMIGVTWDKATMDAEAARIRDLIEVGHVGVVLELLDGIDAYGKPIVRNVASLWGIDSLADGYLADVLADLLGELDLGTASVLS